MDCRSAYLGVVGGSVALSVAHYALNYRRLVGDVPIHFDYLGRPDSFVGKEYFILYPVLVAVCATIGYGIRSGSSAPLRASDQTPARITLATSTALLVFCQHYAAKISRAESRKLPSEALLGLVAVVGSCCVYSLLNGILNP